MSQSALSSGGSATKFGLGLRATITLAIGALAVLVVGLASWRGMDAWEAHKRAVQAQEFDAAANRLIAGLYEVLMERLATNNGLQAAQPAAPALLAEIEKRRKAVAENFAPGLNALSNQDFPEKATLLEDVRQALKQGRKLTIGERTIVTPAARDLAEQHRLFVSAEWPR